VRQVQLRDIQQCNAVCRGCGDACEDTARYCLERGGDHAARDLVGALITCAAVARLVSDYIRDDAELTHATVDFFADVCRAAGEACERVDDPRLRACAERCFWCESCTREALSAD
jgi:hypothetical protein